jgi:predicted dithiol-disulfide oxidoreductase (DUF899 family)
MRTNNLDHPAVVSRDEWLGARKELLVKEKELTRTRDALREARSALPWVKVDTNYIFDGLAGKVTLADLFEAKSQLFVYHLMFGPDWDEPCERCSFNMDHVDGALIHLGQRDVTFIAVSRAPITKIEPFKKRMGWRFNWVSSFGNDFNRDYGVSFTKEELEKGVYYNFGTTPFPVDEAPGFSVFYKNKSDIYHTYSAYSRGTEALVGTYNYLDFVPKGRDEDHLADPMSWVRFKDRY